MAVYKVIQDIESEDKLLGPLTLKGFIYALIALSCGFIDFKLVSATGLGSTRWLVILLFLFPMALFGVLASPIGGQQPTEVWLLGRIRFLVKPRKRLWDQTGLSKLVSIAVPKKIEKQRTKGLSETEVTSRLQTLASTLDSRGWAIKNLNLQPSAEFDREVMSDRLAAPTSVSQQVAISDVRASDDILDEDHNPTAQNFKGLMLQEDAQRKVQRANVVTKARRQVVDVIPGANKLKLGIKQYARPGDHEDEVKDNKNSQSKTSENEDTSTVTAGSRADKLELAQSGSDLSVASIAKLANRKSEVKQVGPNEVVISLH